MGLDFGPDSRTASAVGLVGWVTLELRHRDPLVDLLMSAKPVVVGATAAAVLIGAGITVQEMVDRRGVSAREMLVDLTGMGKSPEETTTDPRCSGRCRSSTSRRSGPPPTFSGPPSTRSATRYGPPPRLTTWRSAAARWSSHASMKWMRSTAPAHEVLISLTPVVCFIQDALAPFSVSL